MVEPRRFNVTVLVRRPEGTSVPTLKHGELCYLHAEQRLYVGGPDGVPVSVNSEGLPGVDGVDGATGPQGIPGLPGADGADGATGPQGPPGPTILHSGTTPPTDTSKLLWAQVSATGELIERWHRAGALWISEQIYPVNSFSLDVTGNAFTSNPNPVPGAQIWIERFSARAILIDAMTASNLIDFKLSLVNLTQVETPFFYVRAQGPAAANSLINVSEPVRQVVNAQDSVGLWFRSLRTGSMKMKFLTMSVLLRRVYAP